MNVAWPASSAADLLHYSVYRRTTTNGPYTRIATGLPAAGYADASVIQRTLYRYVVTATDWIENESAYSPEAGATPLAPALGIAHEGGLITLVWPATSQSYTLHSATNLTPPVAWAPVPGASMSDGVWRLAIAPDADGSRFYRLQSL